MKDTLSVGLLTPLPLNGHAAARQFLGLLIETAPALSPERYGNFEPVKAPFRSIDDCLASWKQPFLWRRKSAPAVEGAVWFANTGRHSAAYCMATGRNKPAEQAVKLVQSAAAVLAVDFAYVHLLTEGEASSPNVPYDMWEPIDRGVTSHDLRRGIPNLCWAAVFGPPYVRLIGQERLLSAPCHSTALLSPGHVYVQLTANPEDASHSFDAFQRVREQTREHLGQDLFWSASSNGPRPRIPTFAV